MKTLKKIVILSAFFIAGVLNAQTTSFAAWVVDAAGTTTLSTIPNGTVLSLAVAASNPTLSSTSTTKIRLKNISSSNTYSYSVIRKIIALNNPPGPSDSAIAYFCFGDFGTCYSNDTDEADEFNVLDPGEETTPLSNMKAYLDEAYTVGYSEIYYKLFNVATGKNGADTLSFTIKYNQFSAIKENNNAIKSIGNVYPNPSTDKAEIAIVLNAETNIKIQVYNSTGALVYNANEQGLSGKNKMNIDCSNLNSGLYFVTLTVGNSKITKRLVINK